MIIYLPNSYKFFIYFHKIYTPNKISFKYLYASKLFIDFCVSAAGTGKAGNNVNECNLRQFICILHIIFYKCIRNNMINYWYCYNRELFKEREKNFLTLRTWTETLFKNAFSNSRSKTHPSLKTMRFELNSTTTTKTNRRHTFHLHGNARDNIRTFENPIYNIIPPYFNCRPRQ